MDFRKAKYEDIPRMLEVFDHAKKFMESYGNTTQWSTADRPREELLRRDIERDSSYVCEIDGRIVGCFVYIYGDDPEPGYAKERIIEGGWKDESPYAVVHRLASDQSAKGIGIGILEWCYEKSGGHVRVDTHPNNKPMQNIMKKLGYSYCGKIAVSVDDKVRLIYEKSEVAAAKAL